MTGIENGMEETIMKTTTARDGIHIAFRNGTTVQVGLQNKTLLGIGSVCTDAKPLRSTAEWIRPEFATPEGEELDRLEFLSAEEQGEKLILRARPWFRIAHRMEWSEHALHLRVNTGSWSHGPFSPEGALFELILEGRDRTLGGHRYYGFSYAYHYHCPGYSIYQLEDKATWELGGRAEGNIFVMRNRFPKALLTKKDAYYSGLTMRGIANPFIFQHKPLYTEMQGFTFQYDSSHALVTVHERPSHVRSLFLKERGDDKLLHFNQFCFESTWDVATPARLILTAPLEGMTDTQVMNHYLGVREELQAELRSYYGIRLDLACPSAHIETWEIAKMENFEPIFEKLHKWGYHSSFIMPLWRSNATDVIPRFANDRERFGDLGGMCCPLELEIADCYGGWEGFARLMEQAKRNGLATYMWFGAHFSSLGPLGERFDGLFAHDVNGQRSRNNYEHCLFAVDQNNQAYQEYLLGTFRRLSALGLGGVFRDSHFNMATDTINYWHRELPDSSQPAEPWELRTEDHITTNHEAELHIQKLFQQELHMAYYVESEGAVGIPMCEVPYEAVRGHEYIYSNMLIGMNSDEVRRCGDTEEIAFFRGLSVRLFYRLNIEVNRFPAEGSVDPWWHPETMVPMLHVYDLVAPLMREMRLLENENGVEWEGNDCSTIFAYRDFTIKIPEGAVFYEATPDGFVPAHGGPLSAFHIYVTRYARSSR